MSQDTSRLTADNTAAAEDSASRWSRALGSVVFPLVLLTFLLPWLSFTVNCNEEYLAPQTGAALLVGTDVPIHVDHQVNGTVSVPPQPLVWLVFGLPFLGAALYFVTGRLGRYLRTGIAIVGMFAASSAAAVLAGADFAYQGTGYPNAVGDRGPYAEADFGVFAAEYVFAFAAALNLTIQWASQEFVNGRHRTWLRAIALSGYAAAVLILSLIVFGLGLLALVGVVALWPS